MSAPSSSGNGGYRDEREAALAQVESLRQRVAALEPECQRLREENDVLRREVARLGGVVGPRRSGVATPIIVVLAAVVAMMFVGGALAFLSRARARDHPVVDRAGAGVRTDAVDHRAEHDAALERPARAADVAFFVRARTRSRAAPEHRESVER
jgi:hypothetical protein